MVQYSVDPSSESGSGTSLGWTMGLLHYQSIFLAFQSQLTSDVNKQAALTGSMNA